MAGDHLLRDPEFDFYPIEDLDVPPSIEKEIRREMQNARNPISKSGFRKEFMTLPDEAWRAATKIVLHIREGDLPPVAKIWTNNSYRGRSALNSHSLEIIMKTGWCPYVIGRNLPWNIDCSSGVINAALANRHRCGKDPTFDGLGKIESAISLHPSNILGTCIRLETDKCNILLDCGDGSQPIPLTEFGGKPTLALITHNHADHIKDLNRLIEDESTFIGMGKTTLELFIDRLGHDGMAAYDYLEEFDFWQRLYLLNYEETLIFPDGSCIRALDVDHYIGSMSYLLTFSNGFRLLYSGDFSCESSYSAYVTCGGESEKIHRDPFPERYEVAILDASMAGKERVPGNADENLRSFVARAMTSGNHCVLLAQPIMDYGLYTFLHLYDPLINRELGMEYHPFFVDANIMRSLSLMEWHARSGQKEHMDSFMRSFARGQNIYSSAQVFAHDRDIESRNNLEAVLEGDLKATFILDPRSIGRSDYFSPENMSRLKKDGMKLGLVGRCPPEALSAIKANWTIDKTFDAAEWMLHSHEVPLRSYIERRSADFGKILLFHATFAKQKEFIDTLSPGLRSKTGIVQQLHRF